jgi:hypothetical protein
MSVGVPGVKHVIHISCVPLGKAWVCGHAKIILTDSTGVAVHGVSDVNYWIGGPHAVNRSGELIYIDKEHSISKRSLDDSYTRLVETESPWKPLSLHVSHSIGNLMVGMLHTSQRIGNVTVYNSAGLKMLTIQENETGHMLYRSPTYITENNNGDIIVSDYDCDSVVVTDSKGKHRFTYTGPPSGSKLSPRGICTDALSNILICDYYPNTIHMIDKDGHFMSLLLTEDHGVNKPLGLDYDRKTHLLWVGSYNTNKLSVYRYIQRRHSLIGEYYDTITHCIDL